MRDPLRAEERGAVALPGSKQGQEQMLRSHRLGSELVRLARRLAEHVLQRTVQRQMSSHRWLVARWFGQPDRSPHVERRDAEGGQQLRRDEPLFSHEARQKVFGSDLGSIQSSCCVLGEDDRPKGVMIEALEHGPEGSYPR